MPTGNRRRFFSFVLVAIVLVVIEASAHAIYFARYGAGYSRSGLARHLAAGPAAAEALLAGGEMAEIAQRRILHPFFGYAMDRPETWGAGGDVPPIQQRGPGRFVVAVAGGSVANQVRSVLGDALRAGFAERGLALEPIVVGLAIDGFKQPQQLSSVGFFLALGADYDAVVNVDGFNDIVLPIVDNHERGVFPYYPRSWNSFVNRRPSQAMLLGAGEIAYLRREQQERLEGARQSLAAASAVVGLYQAARLDQTSRRIAALQSERLRERDALPFEASGPREPVDDIAQVYHGAARVWAESSILLHELLQARGTAYLHVLQPNQYVEGKRTLTPRERARAYDPDHPYARVARRGYPYLFEAADRLRAAGVPYLDATGIFQGIAEPIYSDTCCHVNRRGKRLFAEQVAASLLGQIDAQGSRQD